MVNIRRAYEVLFLGLFLFFLFITDTCGTSRVGRCRSFWKRLRLSPLPRL